MPAPSAPVLALWKTGAFVTHLDVLIERPSGVESVLQSYRAFGGIDFIKALHIEHGSPEQPIGSGVLTLHRQEGGKSLAPLVTESELNQDDGEYAPALDFGREIEIRTCNREVGAEPDPEDWETVFQGVLDDPDFGGKSGDIEVPFRDRSGPLADTYIREKITYGTTLGTDALVVMQAIVDRWMGLGQYTIQDLTVGDRFMVTGYVPIDVSVWDALQAVALMWGAKALRQVKDGTGQFQLSVVEVDRDKTAVDYSIGPATYIDIPELSTGGVNLRTIVKGITSRGGTGEILTSQIPAEEDVPTDPLVEKYGQRPFTFTEDGAKGVDTQPELDYMVQQAYKDMTALNFPMEVETKYAPWAALDDLVTWEANKVLFDQAQQGAAIRITDDFREHGVARTRWRLAERPVGLYHEYLRRDIRISGTGAVEPSPGFASLGTPVLFYTDAVGAQGWIWEGVANKDTNGLFVALSGEISGLSFSPLAIAVAGGYWLDLSAEKVFTLTLGQSAGQVGTVTLTAYSSPAADNRGIASEPQAQSLRLQPVTLLEVTYVTPSTRLLTFTPKPVGASVRYRIGGSGAWTEVATSASAPAVRYTLAIPAGRILVEWQAVLGPYEEEPQKKYFDADDLPSLSALTAIENPASHLTYSVTADDDVVSGELYVKPGSRPVDAGGSPDPTYLLSRRYSGVYKLRTGTWYLLFRGYDVFRRSVDIETSLAIAGTPSSAAVLSNPRATVVATHPELRWAHNTPAIGHKVVILRDGITVLALATGRLVETDSDGSNSTSGEGGWIDTGLTAVASSFIGAVPKTVRYEVRWYTSAGSFVNALGFAPLSFYVSGSSDTGVPTEIPVSPSVELLTGTTAQATWENTTSAWAVRLRWYRNGSLFDTRDLPAGTVFDNISGVSGEQYKFKVSYVNSFGEGTQTGFSNQVTMFGL